MTNLNHAGGMRRVALAAFTMLALLFWSDAPEARECTAGEIGFAMVGTPGGYSWQGITLSVGSFAPSGRGRAKALSAPSRHLTVISYQPFDATATSEDTPSVLREGTMRLYSNVRGFSRKFEIKDGALEGVDLSFCDRQELALRCTGITGFSSEGAISMRCALKIMEPDAVVTP